MLDSEARQPKQTGYWKSSNGWWLTLFAALSARSREISDWNLSLALQPRRGRAPCEVGGLGGGLLVKRTVVWTRDNLPRLPAALP